MCSVAATLISSNFPSLIRDLQQNPSLWEDICFSPVLLSDEGGRSLGGAGCAEQSRMRRRS